MFGQTERKDKFFKDGYLKEECLWPLRKQITLGSVYTADFRNTFGISEKVVQDFFDAYIERCKIVADEIGLMERAIAERNRLVEVSGENPWIPSVTSVYEGMLDLEFDTEERLIDYYRHLPENPLVPHYVNVDITLHKTRSIQVIAGYESEAKDIVDTMMLRGEIDRYSFEEDDWDLDTSYQPDEE